MQVWRVAFALLSAIALPSPVEAGALDLRKRSEPGGPNEISFCARPSPNKFGFPSHAFVAFSDVQNGRRQFLALGRTIGPATSPVGAALSYFGPSVPGEISEELYTDIRQECLTVTVNRDIYEKARVAARPRLTALGLTDAAAARLESYRLGNDDCLAFILDVARAIAPAGFRVPPRATTDLPLAYIGKLRAANPIP